MKKTWGLWAFGDAHVGSDLAHGRESLAQAIRQSEQDPAFAWDLAVNVGDLSGAQGLPADEEGAEVVRQFSALQDHDRHAIYSVCGNHDRSGIDQEAAWWFRKWVDPCGENTPFSGISQSRRPYPVEGSWERYAFTVGNVRFLMMSDINEPSQTVGRGALGGHPGGVVSADTFAWWQQQLADHADQIIISVHHYMLKDTTVASGSWEGMQLDEAGNWEDRYHGYRPLGTPDGASYLYWVGSRPHAQAFERHLQAHPGAVDLWIGGHTHTDPEDTFGGKSHIESRWGTHFLNVSALTRHHVSRARYGVPMSRHLTFTEGSDQVLVRCFLHSSHWREQGWYPPAERTLRLSQPFSGMQA